MTNTLWMWKLWECSTRHFHNVEVMDACEINLPQVELRSVEHVQCGAFKLYSFCSTECGQRAVEEIFANTCSFATVELFNSHHCRLSNEPIRDLGIYVTSNLNWTYHCTFLLWKGYQRCYLYSSVTSSFLPFLLSLSFCSVLSSSA